MGFWKLSFMTESATKMDIWLLFTLANLLRLRGDLAAQMIRSGNRFQDSRMPFLWNLQSLAERFVRLATLCAELLRSVFGADSSETASVELREVCETCYFVRGAFEISIWRWLSRDSVRWVEKFERLATLCAELLRSVLDADSPETASEWCPLWTDATTALVGTVR